MSRVCLLEVHEETKRRNLAPTQSTEILTGRTRLGAVVLDRTRDGLESPCMLFCANTSEKPHQLRPLIRLEWATCISASHKRDALGCAVGQRS